jgi:N-acetylmuramoyl-L-alanine amidase
VVHTTAGTFASTAAWFADPESGVSAHYLVALDGRVAQFVDERDVARHAGRVLRPTASIAEGGDDLNPITIGIELEDGGDAEHVERPDAQYAAAAAHPLRSRL